MLKSSFYIFSISTLLILFTTSGTNKTLPGLEEIYSEDHEILVAAHRGSHENFPENSIPAILESIKNGIDIVEIDIRETRDNIPVLMHDKKIDRTTNGQGYLKDIDHKELEKYNLLFEGKPSMYRIPDLEEALITAKDKIILNLDFKLDDLEAMRRSYEIISRHNMEDAVIFTVNDLKLIPELYRLNPEIRIMPVAFSWWKINEVVDHDFLDIIQLYHRPYRKQNLKRLENKEMEIWVNSLKKYDRLESKNKNGFENLIRIKKVDVVQTDYPEELLKFLREKGLHK